MLNEKRNFSWGLLVIYSLFAGVCIGFAAVLYLYASTLDGTALFRRTVPAILFGFGLYFVIVMDYNLFTGMVAGLSDMKPKEWPRLIVCYVFNTLAILVLAVMIFGMQNTVSNAVIAQAAGVAKTKLESNLFGSFLSAVFCGMMITFAVKSHQRAKEKGLSGTIGILFPVTLFVFMGFEHCIANQTYIFLAILGKAELSGLRIFLFALVTALGNIVGGVIFPLLTKLADHLSK